MTGETFYVYYVNSDKEMVYMSFPRFEEGHVVEWGMTLNPGEAFGFGSLDEAAKYAEELTFVGKCVAEDDPEYDFSPWAVVAAKIYLDRI